VGSVAVILLNVGQEDSSLRGRAQWAETIPWLFWSDTKSMSVLCRNCRRKQFSWNLVLLAYELIAPAGKSSETMALECVLFNLGM
jgi:hypothetical protein